MLDIEYEYVLIAISFALLYISFVISKFTKKDSASDSQSTIIGKQYLQFLFENMKASSTQNFPSTDVTKFQENTAAIPFFTVIYATQSNTAKKFSERIYHEAIDKFGLKCQMKNISDVSIDDFNKNAFLVFLVSTYGEGGPTDDCIEFNNKFLDSEFFYERFSNSDLAYAIFGLGNSKYQNFNSMARKFDQVLSKANMQRVCVMGIGDDSKKIENDFEEWKNNEFWPSTCGYFIQNAERYSALVEKLKIQENFNFQENSQEVEAVLANPQEIFIPEFQIDMNAYAYETQRFLCSEQCPIADIVEMRKDSSHGSTLKITYNLEQSNLAYQVADNLGIFPCNSEKNVEKIITALNYNPNLVVRYTKFNGKNLNTKLCLPDQMTVKEILTNVIDLSCHIKKDLLTSLVDYISDEEQYTSVQKILKNEKEIEEFTSKGYNVVDLVTEYDSISIPFFKFCELIPKITPRFFTVASSPNLRKNKVDIIISLHSWNSIVRNERRYGLASSYYREAYMSRNLNAYKTKLVCRSSSFRLPVTKDPFMMISAGSGIAPFITFLEELSVTKASNETFLLFGSRNRRSDFLYENELSNFQSQGILNHLYLAFSRDQDHPVHVQDIIATELRSQIADLILNKKLIIYICGGVSMGREIVSCLESIVSAEVIRELEKSNRLIMEMWGV